MSKLFKLKSFVTIDQAAIHLSTMLKEPVNESDLLQLALEGKITLSINLLNREMVHIGKSVDKQIARKKIYPMGLQIDQPIISVENMTPDIKEIIDSLCFTESGYHVDPKTSNKKLIEVLSVFYPNGICRIALEGKPIPHTDLVLCIDRSLTQTTSGLWDIPIIGSGMAAIEIMYAELLGNHNSDESITEEVYLHNPDKDIWAELLQDYDTGDGSREWIPANHLPDNYILCIRQAEIKRFLDQLMTEEIPTKNKTITTGKRKGLTYTDTTYLNVIGALLDLLMHPASGRKKSRAEISRQIEEKHKPASGVSVKTCEQLFPDALKSLENEPKYKK